MRGPASVSHRRARRMFQRGVTMPAIAGRRLLARRGTMQPLVSLSPCRLSRNIASYHQHVTGAPL